MSQQQPIEHCFRHEYGKLIAILTQKFGLLYLPDIEDAVQSALMKALESWQKTSMPEKPSAWLYTVAYNHLIATLRQNKRRTEIVQTAVNPEEQTEKHIIEVLEESEEESLLNWLFTCCHSTLATESQLVFALKTLCGFSTDEIALRLFISPTNVYKRYTRARKHLRDKLDNLNTYENHSSKNLNSVHKILYLIFTEGYLSSHLHTPIRRELCQESLHLTTLLAKHKKHDNPQTYALLALMHLQYSRINARTDADDNLLMLDDQDRSLWDQSHIYQGMMWLQKSACGDVFSRYHAEASIAMEHCLASSFETTRWDKIIDSYLILEKHSPSILHQMNRALATAQWQGPEAGLAVLENCKPPSWLEKNYQWHAVVAELNHHCSQSSTADDHLKKALNLAPTQAIKRALIKRFEKKRNPH